MRDDDQAVYDRIGADWTDMGLASKVYHWVRGPDGLPLRNEDGTYVYEPVAPRYALRRLVGLGLVEVYTASYSPWRQADPTDPPEKVHRYQPYTGPSGARVLARRVPK